MSIPQKLPDRVTPASIEDVLIRGDLSKLTEPQRSEYYLRLCNSIGLNPLTKPFQYITLNGKLVLYAGRDCADQLRKLNGISIKIVSQEKADGLLTIHVHAKDRDGREDEDLGVVAWGDYLKGEAAANQMLKCVTKAKRRVTLSISGLGFLDETEIADIPAAAKQVPAQNGTGEVIMPDQVAELQKMLKMKPHINEKSFCNYLGLSDLSDLSASRYNEAVAAITEKRKQMEGAA